MDLLGASALPCLRLAGEQPAGAIAICFPTGLPVLSSVVLARLSSARSGAHREGAADEEPLRVNVLSSAFRSIGESPRQ